MTIVLPFLMLGCRPEPPVAELDLIGPLPSVAAQFQTIVATANGTSEVEWRIWRSADRVIVENLTERTADHWERDGNAVFRRRMFHDERRGVEFQPNDLQLLVGTEQWNARALSFDPHLLTVLPQAKTGWRGERPFRRFAGEIGGTKWNITVAVDLMLPMDIDRRTAAGTERTRLVAASTEDLAPWQPVPTAGYELIDFADFGDRQADPFVSRVQAQLGLGHAH